MIFLELFWTFFTIGAFTFGGGYAMLPLIRESVAAKGWMTEEALVDFIAVSESTPGPFAVNMATYVGSQVGGIFGSVCATLGVVLPSFCIIQLLARCFAKFRQSRAVQGAMSGLKPAVVGLIGAAALSIGETVFFPAGISASVFTNAAIYVSLGIFLVSAVLALKKVHPILVICRSAVLGIVSGFIMG